MAGMPQFPTPVPIPLCSLTVPSSSYAPPPWGKIKCRGLQALQGVFSQPSHTVPLSCPTEANGPLGKRPFPLPCGRFAEASPPIFFLLFYFSAIQLSK